MLARSFLAVVALLHLTHSLPTNIDVTKRQEPLLETWSIPRLDMHMMSIHTGLPGDTWLPGTLFNSTIDFDVLIPDHTLPPNTTTPRTITSNCKASFLNGTLPSGRTYCTPPSTTEVLFFEMYAYTDLGPRRPELSFMLDLTSAINFDEQTSTAETFYWGRKAITANDPHEPSSYLTCLEGVPFDGLRCSLKSYLSVDEELEVDVELVNLQDVEER